MRIINLSVFPLILMASLLMMVESITFSIGWTANGLINWSNDCDFNQFDLLQIPNVGTYQDCGTRCLANPSCTHFTITVPKVCILKQNFIGEPNVYNGAKCGWVSRPGGSTVALTAQVAQLTGNILLVMISIQSFNNVI